MDDREIKLPVWARELLTNLRLRLKAATEPLVAELAKTRPQMELLKAKNEAMTDLLECAARGGHKTSQEIVEILQGYDLTLTKRND